MTKPLVSILIPHYRTLDLTKLCLALLRKYTSLNRVKLIVIENGSNDGSVEYLRTLNWITLLERQTIPNQAPTAAHSAALDLALDQVDTPYVLSIHTDTLVKHPQWLDFLLEEIEKDPNIAGVGSWKLENKSPWRKLLKQLEYGWQRLYFAFIGKTQHGLAGVGKNYYYLRSHCALYRVDLLKKFNLHFSDGDTTAGKALHQSLSKAGYRMVFIPSEVLVQYVEHINHATTVLNPHLSTREKSVIKGRRRIEKSLNRLRQEVNLERLDEPFPTQKP